MKSQTIIVSVLVFLSVAGGSFYGGMRYGASKSKSAMRNPQGMTFGQNMPSGMRTGGAGMGGAMRGAGMDATNGEILSKDDTSFTLKTSDGSSKVVLFSASTTVGEMTVGSMDSLVPGKTVTVMGKAGADGSITATMVQIRSADAEIGGPFGRPGGAPIGEEPEGE